MGSTVVAVGRELPDANSVTWVCTYGGLFSPGVLFSPTDGLISTILLVQLSKSKSEPGQNSVCWVNKIYTRVWLVNLKNRNIEKPTEIYVYRPSMAKNEKQANALLRQGPLPASSNKQQKPPKTSKMAQNKNK